MVSFIIRRTRFRLLLLVVSLSIVAFNLAAQDVCEHAEATYQSFKSTPYSSSEELDLDVQSMLSSDEILSCQNYELISDLYYRIGVKYLSLGIKKVQIGERTEYEWTTSRKHFTSSIQYLVDSLNYSIDHDKVLKSEINIGVSNLRQDKDVLAKQSFESVFNRILSESSSFVRVKVLFYLGETYKKLGVHDRAVFCLKQVIEICETLPDSEFALVGNYYTEAFNLLGVSHLGNGRPSEAILAFQDYRLFGDPIGNKWVQYLNNRAEAWYDLGEYDSVLQTYQILENYLLEEFEVLDSSTICNCFLGVSRANLKKGDRVAAMNYLTRAKQLCGEHELVVYHDNLGDYYAEGNERKEALTSYYQSIQSAYGASLSSNNEKFTLTGFSGATVNWQSQEDLLEILPSFANEALLLYNESNNSEYLIYGFEAYKLFEEIYLQSVQNRLTEDSKYRLITAARVAFEKAIHVCYELKELRPEKSEFYLNRAFMFAERIRANLLYSNVLKGDADHMSLIPDSVKAQIQSIKSDIRFLEDKLQSEDAMDGSTSQKLERSIQSSEIELDHLYALLQQKYPSYSGFIEKSHEVVDVMFVQNELLDPKTILVEYFLAGNELYVFGMSQKSSSFRRIKFNDELENTLDIFLKSITDKDYIETNYKTSIDEYFSTSFRLYQALLHQILIDLQCNEGTLIIIPDDKLNVLPFATLTTELAKNLSRADFLINSFDISYDYSAKSYSRNQSSQRSKGLANEICIFAPTYENSIHQELPFVEDEVEKIKSVFNKPLLFWSEKASKNNFNNTCNACEILHLSLHGILDQEEGLNNYLAFHPDSSSDGQLKISDVYRSDINASLTVLSACNTAIGEHRESEGLVSISNAFSYAGSAGVWASLWPVYDMFAVDMSDQFYKKALKGKPLSYAASEAQRFHISSNANSKYIHPYYWGNMVLTGCIKPISNRSTPYYYLFGVVFLLSLFGIWSLKNRKA